MACRFHHLLLLTSALLPLAAAPALAGPDGANVVGGAATIQGQGTANVTINQISDRAVINWNQFNIGAGERTQFVQPGSSSVALNRVTGGLGPTEILGTLSANGRVFVINRDGILFGPNAKVDTAGFLATTSDIKNSDFMAGRYNFNIPGRPDASIINQGTITAHNAGFAALVAPGVRNSGTITATLGTVGLAAGNSFTLDFYGDKLISLAVGDQIGATVRDVQTGRPLTSLVENTGRISANGGRVELTAAAARHVVDSVINNRGVIEANTIGRRNGMIVLGAATAGSRPADAPRQTVRVSGTLSASATAGRRHASGAPDRRQGGRVVITGENIEVSGARIDVSAPAGGGTVLIGGDWAGGNPDTTLFSHPRAQLENRAIATATTVTIDQATVIDASARERGTGGKVIVWSDGTTSFGGSIVATGGAQGGDGGFVEVSGRQHLDYAGTVDLRAPAGTVGTLLLDPTNMYINATGTPPVNDPGASAVSATQIQNQLATANVVITTGSTGTQAGDINVQASISWGTNSGLTLSAFHDIIVAAGVTIANTNQASGTLVLRADNTATGSGTVKFLEPFNPGPEPNPPRPIQGDGPLTNCVGGCGPLPSGPNEPRGGGNGFHVAAATAPAIDFSQSQGHVAIFYNPTSYTSPNDYSANVAGQLTSFMLVNNATNLANIATNPGGTYALGGNINASTFTGMPAGTVFTGVLDGNGGLGVNSTISNLGAPLFPTIAAGTSVRNMTLTNVNISATGDNQIIGALARENFGNVENSSASGVINGGSFTGLVIGGLIGQNVGSISHSSASVNVNVGNTTAGQFNFAGGLVGNNIGSIGDSSASGRVAGGASAADSDFNVLGGLVANNFGTIDNSQASGQVTLGAFGIVGGFVGINGGTITKSSASGETTGGDQAFAGGFAGWNFGTIGQSAATGAVNAGSSSFAGGFAGLNVVGSITLSSAAGAVTAGAESVAGGLVGVNMGFVGQSFATGAVTAGADSHVGGLVGINLGLPADIAQAFPSIPIGTISQAFATGAVTGGANSNVGGLVGNNGGTIDQTYATGLVTGGADARLGGLVASNDAAFTLPGDLPISGGPQQGSGTVTNSYWDRQTTQQNASAGGTGLTTAQLTAGLPAGFDASVWGINVGQSYPFFQPGGPVVPTPPLNPPPLPPDVTPPDVTPPTPPDVIPPLPPLNVPFIPTTTVVQQVMDLVRTVDWNPTLPPPVFTQAQIAQIMQQGQLRSTTQQRQSNLQPGGNQPLRPDGRPSNVPPPGETRFISDRVVVQLSVSPDTLTDLFQRLGLVVISSQRNDLLGTQMIEFQITSGLSVREVIIELEKNRLVDAAPDYLFELAQAAPAPAGAAAPAGAGDPAQYMVSKLRLAEAHQLAKGDNVLVAVIDSEIDAKHPDLEGAIQARYEGAGPADKAHPHGTGMAGAIASHRKLMGVAPGARLLAIRAFGGPGGGAQGTTVQIAQGLDWAVSQGARIVNMSFAGPKDPTLQKAFKAAFDKGVVLIAAAGNAGPKSPPLYPGADSNVIAVSATDEDNKVYTNANRGKYVAVAAPGVDILVPAPDGNYEFTTGTSVAAAHVSGVVALMLQRNPKLDPTDVREILTSSANNFGARSRTDELGWGLVDPYRALQLAAAKSASAPAPAAGRVTTARRN